MKQQHGAQASAQKEQNTVIGFAARIIRLLDKTPQSIISLFARIIMFMVFYASARTKVEGFTIKSQTFMLFEYEYNLPVISPVVATYLATFAEFFFPALLLLGLAARFGAAGLLFMTFIIEVFVYPEAYVLHGLWAIALLVIIARGPGVFSIDHLIRKKYM